MEAGRELDRMVATKVMGATCLHEREVVPTEVVAANIAAEWEEEYGEPCPSDYAESQARFHQEFADRPDFWCGKCQHRRLQGVEDTGMWSVPRYSTNIAAAWEVVERMWRKHDMDLSLRVVSEGAVAVFGAYNEPVGAQPHYRAAVDPRDVGVKAPPDQHLSALAICLAALRACGVEV